jgi:peptidoglycan biosynthesis protein MviN/MurJ (putative lipid II flippase)
MPAAERREDIADRVKIPFWYMLLSVVALVALFALPALTKHGHREVAVWAITIPAVAILSLVGLVIRRNSGLNLSRDSRALPSTRPVTYATLIAVAVGATITWLVADWGTAGATLVAGAICAAVVLVVEQQALAAIRREIRHGG